MILVTGGTGTVGRELVKELHAMGSNFRVLVRSREKAPVGVEVVVGDLAQPNSMGEALAGVDTMFLLTNVTPDTPRIHKGVIDAAAKAGVRRMVRLSVPDAEKNTPIAFARWHAESDDHLRASGLDWTLLCPAYFSQNFFRSAGTIRSAGVFYGAMKGGKAAFVDARDIAAVAARVLTERGQGGASLHITGSALHTQSEAAAILSTVTGKSVRYIDLPPEQLKAGALAGGLPEWLAKDYVTMHVAFSNGIGEHISSAVRDITGMPARTFEEFAHDHKKAFS
jgi:uncharacterized protein YbjT (DUF2867 family)